MMVIINLNQIGHTMKSLFILIPAILLTSYANAQDDVNCPSDKNYLHVNHALIDQYKQDFKDNKIKSVYYDYSELRDNYDVIESYEAFGKDSDVPSFAFVEKKLKLDNDGYSLYKIESFKKGDSSCNYEGKSNDANCYKFSKINSPESEYSLVRKKTGNNSFEVTFTNLKTNEKLYDYAYTVYKANPDSIGVTWCQLSPETSLTDQSINTQKFPSDPLFKPK